MEAAGYTRARHDVKQRQVTVSKVIVDLATSEEPMQSVSVFSGYVEYLRRVAKREWEDLRSSTGESPARRMFHKLVKLFQRADFPGTLYTGRTPALGYCVTECNV